MFFKQLTLRNFRNIGDLELSFTTPSGDVKPMTLLLGENGTGKSGILKAIAMITAGSSALGNILEEPDSWIKYGKNFCEIKAVLTTKGKEERHLSLRINKGDQLRDVMNRSNETLREIDDALEHATRNYFLLGYGASRRLNSEGDHFKRKSSYRYDNVATIFDANAVLSPLESWAIDLDYQHGATGLNTVKKVLGEFLGDVRFHSIDRKKKQLLFKTPYGIVPLGGLSDGYQNVAAWIGDLLYRISTTFEDYKRPLNTRGVLLIDEVDLHLHPVWQRQLLTFLKHKLPNFQIIATTHSALTAQQAEKGELFILRKSGRNKIEVDSFRSDPTKLQINQLLTSNLFGLKSSRSKKVEDLVIKREQILEKAVISKTGKITKLSAAEKKQLSEIDKQMETLATGRNPADIEAMELIRQMTSKLK